jgi:threonine/homoserine efflux transporter RhtA
MRRVRATFLLRCVILAACVGLVVVVPELGMAVGWTVGTLVFMAIFWFVGIESSVLPLAIERIAVHRAPRRRKRIASIWFVGQGPSSV